MRADDGGSFDDATNIVISLNSIYNNADSGIVINNAGANDGMFNTDHPNDGIDHPIITNANLAGSNLTLTGYVGTAPGDTDFANARIEFFESDGSSEGQTYLGVLTTDANGNYSGTLAVTSVVDTDAIVATATMTGIGTSEFGNAFDVNVAPVNSVPGAQNATEDITLSIGGVSVGDADTNVISVSLSVTDGLLSVTLQGSASLSSGSNGSSALTISGTQAEINSTLATLLYQGATNYNGTDSLAIVSTDAGGLTDTDSVDINVAAVNDAPTLTNGSTVNLAGTNEDTISAGSSVASIFASAGGNDVDASSLSGIAITSLTGNGTWQYSTDGTNWTDFPSVATNNALLLTSTSQVRYAPDTIDGETATLAFIGWDQTTSTGSSTGSPSLADPTGAQGGINEFSTESATASMVVTSVNDAVIAVADTGDATEAGGVSNANAGSNATGNVLSNDTEVDPGDTLNVTGVAAGTVASANTDVATSVTGTYGNITINANGSYTYVVDEANAIVQALRTSSDTIADTFTYTVTDSGGATSSTQVVITIDGQNDAPVAVVDTAIAVEAGGLANADAGTNPTGNVLTNDTDVDAGDTKTVTGDVVGAVTGSVGASVAGTYGAITINSDGSYNYIVDNSNAAVEALRTSGDTLDDVFTYTMTDTDGATSSTQITVTIQGQNDDPGAVDDGLTAVESGGVSNATAGSNGTGNVLTNDTDIDSGDSQTVTGVDSGSQSVASGNVGSGVAGTYGTLTIDSSGNATFVVNETNSAVQALRTVSDTLTEVFTYTMQDASGADSTAEVTVTITGQNDAPVAVANTATAIEASGINNNISGTDPSGNVLTNDTDVDAGDTQDGHRSGHRCSSLHNRQCWQLRHGQLRRNRHQRRW